MTCSRITKETEQVGGRLGTAAGWCLLVLRGPWERTGVGGPPSGQTAARAGGGLCQAISEVPGGWLRGPMGGEGWGKVGNTGP